MWHGRILGIALSLVCPGRLGAAPSGEAPDSNSESSSAAQEPAAAEPARDTGAPEGAAEQSPALTPPRPLSVEVFYPDGAVGSAVVVLELLVQRDGSVGSATSVSGPEPFASAAREAAASFRFEPALRGGQPVAARIRFEIRYQRSERAPELAPPTQAPGPAPAAQVTEVQVLGEVPAGSVSLTSAEARLMPGAFGDPFRAVSALPGVGEVVTGLPLFFVRGAPPGNLGFFIDGIRVPLLFHAFLGPAVIHPRMIERVELHAGGYPASFGRFSGGVVNADLVEPARELAAEGSIRLYDAGLFVNAPFAEGRGHAILAGRYSYSALLLSLISPEIDLSYWDYQALVSYDLSSRARLGVFAFGAFDALSIASGSSLDPGVTDGQSGFGEIGADESAVLFHRIDLRYDQRLRDSKLRAAVTLGSDATRGAQGLAQSMSLGGRLELRSQLNPAVLFRAGSSFGVERYELELHPDTENYTDVVQLFPGRQDAVLGAWMDFVLDAAPDVTLTPGLRLDRYASAGASALAVSPRLSASFRVSERVSIEHAFGLAHQPPNFVPGVLPGVAVAGLPGGLQRSAQVSAGVRAELPYALSGMATLYQHAYFRLTDPFGQNQDLELDAEEAFVRSTGRSVGLELMLSRRSRGRFGGMLSYTLSRTTRSHGRVHTLYGYDRPHVLSMAGSYNLGRQWLAGARSVFYSGVPGSRTLGARRVFDGERAAPFFRLDLRLEKRFALGSGAFWAVIIELMNASASREVLRRSCEPGCRDETVGPILLPNVGLMGQY